MNQLRANALAAIAKVDVARADVAQREQNALRQQLTAACMLMDQFARRLDAFEAEEKAELQRKIDALPGAEKRTGKAARRVLAAGPLRAGPDASDAPAGSVEAAADMAGPSGRRPKALAWAFRSPPGGGGAAAT